MSTSATTSVESLAAPHRSPFISWLAVISVTLGLFAIVTSEILPIGLLTSIGSSFAISDGMAGLMMVMPGLLAAVSAPVVTVATGRIDRRVMLGVFVLLLALANFLAAVASSYWLILIARVLVGITIGGFWSIGAGLAGQLIPAESTDRATSVIFSSVPLGSVIGVPLGTFIGDLVGWRAAFLVMGAFTLAVLVLLLAVVPPLPSGQATTIDALGGMLRSVNTRFALVATFLVVLAHFGLYTYVTPFLEQVTHVRPGLITIYLLIYGVVGIIGNFLGGSMVGRYPRSTFATAAALIGAAALLLPVLGRSDTGAVALLVVWGLAYGAVPVCSQTWFSKAGPDSPEASSVLFTASFQATISIGALVGGTVLDHSSPSTLMVLGGLTAALTLLVAWTHWAKGYAWPRSS